MHYLLAVVFRQSFLPAAGLDLDHWLAERNASGVVYFELWLLLIWVNNLRYTLNNLHGTKVVYCRISVLLYDANGVVWYYGWGAVLIIPAAVDR